MENRSCYLNSYFRQDTGDGCLETVCHRSIHTERAKQATKKEVFQYSESLFADDTTLIGWTQELNTEKEKVKKILWEFVKSVMTDGKQENVSFGSGEAVNTGMLGTRIGLREDVEAWLKRGYHSWSKVKQWLWTTPQNGRTRVNMYAVRQELGIASIRTKLETRVLERLGHILQMPQERLVKSGPRTMN